MKRSILFLLFSILLLVSCSNQHEHTYNDTLSYDDKTHYYEANCGHDLKKDISDHQFKTEDFKETYEEEGYTVYTCTVCGYTYKGKYKDKLTHHYEDNYSYDDNYHFKKCIDEGYLDLTTTPKAHKYKEEKYINYATPRNNGLIERTCKECGYEGRVEYEYLPSTDKLKFELNSDNTYSIVSADSSIEALVIPETYNGLLVTKIKENAFIRCLNLNYIFISKNISEIEERAFKLKGVKTIAVDPLNPTFDSRENLNGIVSTINNEIVLGCAKTKIVDSIESIGHNAFYYVEDLVSISIGKNLNHIESDSFYGCNFIYDIIVSEENETFDSRDNSNAIILSETNKIVLGCSSTKIPEDVTSIGSYAFSFMDAQRFTIPKGIKEIEDYAFYNASSLRRIEFSEGLEAIGKSAFENTDLFYLNIPTTVSLIKERAFLNTSLSHVSFNQRLKKNTIEILDEAFKNTKLTEFDFFYVTRINENVFENTDLNKVSIGPYVSYISNTLFKNNWLTISFDNDNPYYDFIDNEFLIEKETGLLLYGNSIYSLPEEVKIVGSYSISKNLVISDNNKNIKILENAIKNKGKEYICYFGSDLDFTLNDINHYNILIHSEEEPSSNLEAYWHYYIFHQGKGFGSILRWGYDY